MIWTHLLHLIGWIGVALSVIVNVPQAWKLYRTRSCGDLSVRTYQLLTACLVCLTIQAIAEGSWVFIISQGVGLIVSVAVLYLCWKYGLVECPHCDGRGYDSCDPPDVCGWCGGGQVPRDVGNG